MIREANDAVSEATGFRLCYGCAKCTSGCPMAGKMDRKPHEVMRLLQLGQIDEAVAAAGPWACVGCQTCVARCPNGVDIAEVLGDLRREALRRGQAGAAGSIPAFDELFLDMVRRRGRVNDGLVALRMKLRTGGLLKDWRIGMKMWRAGKLKLRSDKVVDRKGVARLFEPSETPEERS